MTRFLILGIVGVVAYLMIRRAFVSLVDDMEKSQGKSGPPALPDTLVCVGCGAQYNPKATGEICPECGK